MNASALVMTGVGQIELHDITIPSLEPGEVLIETHYSCISPGTELRCYSGTQSGLSGYPIIPGYALSGVVIGVGEGVDFALGTRVFCGGSQKASLPLLWGGHVSHAVRKSSEVFPIAENVDFVSASIAKLTSIAYHGLRLSRIQQGEKVAVVGLGPLGQLAARLYTAHGGTVGGADLSDFRVGLAASAGISAVKSTANLNQAFQDVFPDGVDIVVDSTGVAKIFSSSMGLLKAIPWDNNLYPANRFIVQGSYTGEFGIPYDDAFQKEIELHVSRDCQARDIIESLALMASGKLKVSDLITVKPLSEASATYDALRSSADGLLTAAFEWKMS